VPELLPEPLLVLPEPLLVLPEPAPELLPELVPGLPLEPPEVLLDPCPELLELLAEPPLELEAFPELLLDVLDVLPELPPELPDPELLLELEPVLLALAEVPLLLPPELPAEPFPESSPGGGPSDDFVELASLVDRARASSAASTSGSSVPRSSPRRFAQDADATPAPRATARLGSNLMVRGRGSSRGCACGRAHLLSLTTSSL
jgi:hypothetical protein